MSEHKQYTSFKIKCSNKDGHAFREFLSKIGDKWTVIVIITLYQSPKQRARFSDLQRHIDGISKAMLTSTLRNLERDGLVIREVFPEVPPRVEYELTPMGESLFNPLKQLANWVTENWSDIQKARERCNK